MVSTGVKFRNNILHYTETSVSLKIVQSKAIEVYTKAQAVASMLYALYNTHYELQVNKAKFFVHLNSTSTFQLVRST